MLNIVGDVLAELNINPTHAPIHYYINISTLHTISISAYLDANTFYQIKASEFVNLSPQFDTHSRAWTKYSNFVPEPLGYREREGWSIIVIQGVQHVPFHLERALQGQRALEGALQDLYLYFDTCGQPQSVGINIESHDNFLTTLERHFLNTSRAALAAKWISIARSMGVESLRFSNQHGDFTENNIAYSGERLIIFDWEDYGACKLPGLDLISLIFSVCPTIESILELTRAKDESQRPIDIFIRRVCRSFGFDMQFFQQLFPFYLLTLLYSKRNYGHPLQARIDSLLDRLTL